MQARVEALSLPLGATAGGAVLLGLGEPVVQVLIAVVAGFIVGQAAKLVMAFGGMWFGAESSGYGDVFGETPEERARGPSRWFVVYGWLFLILPPLIAALGAFAAGAILR